MHWPIPINWNDKIVQIINQMNMDTFLKAIKGQGYRSCIHLNEPPNCKNWWRWGDYA